MLSLAGARAASAAAPVVSVTSPSYDSPGGTVAAVVTVANVPAGWSISTMSARVGAGTYNCDPYTWKHAKGVSEKCAVTMPTVAGTWSLRASVTLAKRGQKSLTYAGARTIKTQGSRSYASLDAAHRMSITKCYNMSKSVWLTFDDGYTSQANLNSILSTLKAYNVRGRFFLVGSWARTHSSMVNQIKAGGHYLENHSDTHPALSSIGNYAVLNELAHGVVPTNSTKLLRPPYGAGAFTTRLYDLAAGQGYRLCYWGTDTADWSGVSSSVIVSKVVTGDSSTPPARAGDTVLMHLTNTNTRYALASLIKSVRAKGLVLDRLR
jgi:peptidoglycan/xylan/chitin deacetylase (PgdA/CDA1 family)